MSAGVTVPPAVLEGIGLEPVHTLLANERKRTVVLLVRRDEETAVLKWCAPDAPGEARADFEAERAAYTSGRFAGLAPRLLGHGPNHLLLQRVEGETLRSALAGAVARGDAGDAVGRAYERLCARLVEAYGPGMRSADADPAGASSALLRLYWVLASSGPMATSRSAAARAVSRGLARFGRPLAERALADLLRAHPELAARGPAHGDLHLDNVILDGHRSAYVFDLARSSEDGFPVADLAYLLSTTLVLTSPAPDLRQRLVQAAASRLAAMGPAWPRVLDVARLLACVGAANRRFNSEAGAVAVARAAATFPFALSAAAAGLRREGPA